jgi:hypothetical protein
MTSDRAALREKVARAIMKAWVNGRSTPDDFVSTATDAAIDLVLEEAARVAEEQEDYTAQRANGVLRRSIAAAIRGLKSNPGSGS